MLACKMLAYKMLACVVLFNTMLSTFKFGSIVNKQIMNASISLMQTFCSRIMTACNLTRFIYILTYIRCALYIFLCTFNTLYTHIHLTHFILILIYIYIHLRFYACLHQIKLYMIVTTFFMVSLNIR